jgi:hypothetical protein
MKRVARPDGEVIAPSFHEPMPLESDQISQVTGGALQSIEPPSSVVPVPPIGFPPIVLPPPVHVPIMKGQLYPV